VYEHLIASLIPSIAPPRAAALAPLQSRVDVARLGLADVRTSHAALVEQLARVDLKRLQPRVRAEVFPLLGRVNQLALDLRAALDHADVPVDARDAQRAAVGAVSDADFNGSMVSLTRAVDRYTGATTHAEVLAHLLDAALAELGAADVWSETFVVQMPAEQRWSPAS
jgi:hypothetical protein